MINNKGLTLVELLGVLIVLGMLVMIVTPAVTRNLKTSQVELCEHQLDSLEAAAKNWLTDQINDNYNDMFNENGSFKDVYVSATALKNGGYVSELSDKYNDVAVYIEKTGNNYSYTAYKQVKNGDSYNYVNFDCSA